MSTAEMGPPQSVADPTYLKPGKTLTPSIVRDRFDRGSSALKREQYEYSINRSFLAGEQWLYYDSIRNTIQQLPRDPSRTRVTMNRLWPISRHLMAKLLSRPLVFEVPPNEADDASIRGAHTAEAIMEDLHRGHRWEDYREDLAWSTWIGGTAIFAIDWDPSKGTSLGALPESGKPYGTGEIVESALNICEVAWEPGTRDAESSNWWVRAQALPPAEVKATYELKDMPPTDATAMLTPLTQKLMRGERSGGFTPLTLVLTYYERPNRDRPAGAVATMVGNEFVDGPKPWPFPFKDRLNMVVMRETKVPGRAPGTTVFSAAVPIQTAYNASWSNIIEHMKLAGNARMLIPEAALDGIDDLTDLPAELLLYAGPQAPTWMTPPTMPAWWVEQPEKLSNQLDDVLGLHEASRGEMPRNVDSGVGLSVLIEQDSTPLGKLTREMAAGFERAANLCLQIYADKVVEQRKAKLTNRSIPETVLWSGRALQGQTNVVIPIDAVMPRSHAADFSMAQNMWDRKLLTTPEQFAQVAQIPGQENLLETMNRDAAKAMRENDELAMDITCLPADFDDHKVHIAKHNDFRKTSRYESMPAATRDLIDLHIKAHETMAAEQAGMQVAKGLANPVLPTLPTAGDAAPLPEGVQLGPGEPPMPPTAVADTNMIQQPPEAPQPPASPQGPPQ